MEIKRTNKFIKSFDKLDNSNKIKVIKQIEKIIENPNIGKPMKYERKDTRELYLKPFRISYTYFKIELEIFIDNLSNEELNFYLNKLKSILTEISDK